MNKALEDLQAGRDPFAPPPEEQEHESGQERCQRLARWSFWLRVVAGLLLLGMSASLSGLSAKVEFLGMLATTGLCTLMIVASLILAIIALCGVHKYGPEGILGRSVRGIITCVLFLGYIGHTVVDGVRADLQNHQALAELREAGNKVRAETRDDFDQKGGITPGTQAQRVNELKGAVDKAALHATGDAALLLQGTSAYAGRVQALTGDYAAAAKALLEPPVLSMSGVTRREQLLEKKETVRKFMAANEKLEAFMVKAGDNYRKELEKTHCPPDKVEATLAAFEKQSQGKSQFTLQIREADQRKGTALLGMLDVLDANWGRWHFVPETKKVSFDSDAALDKYISYRESMDAAAQEQTRLQSQLLTIAGK